MNADIVLNLIIIGSFGAFALWRYGFFDGLIDRMATLLEDGQ
jgi:hypothetical protein